jgi:HEAT repeat protein
LRGLKAEIDRLRNENDRLQATVASEKSSTGSEWMPRLATLKTNWMGLTDIPFLLDALTNDAIPVRLQAAQILRNIGLHRILNTNLSSEAESELRAEARASVPGLISALQDSDSMVRANAAITLGFLDEPDQAVPALVACLDDKEDRVSTGAAKALGRLGPGAASAVPALLELAKSSSDWRRETAINAIKQINPDAARAAGFQ